MNNNHDVYLCQVSETVSCGACCGLYNLPELSREKVENLLAGRTEDFASVPRTEDDIFDFKRRNAAPHRLSRPFAQFHHCPFLGLIGNGKRRVGCLLHPEAPGNNGIDYRSLSWYGEMACRSYFCPATRKMPSAYQAILKESVDNWYDFGLIVTEYSLLTAYFREMEARLGRQIAVSDYSRNLPAKNALKDFVRLKSIWPHRRHDAPGPCNFFFENGLYPRPEVFRATLDIRLSPYEEIFKELDTGFSSEEEVETAERLLNALFVKAEQALTVLPTPGNTAENTGSEIN